MCIVFFWKVVKAFSILCWVNHASRAQVRRRERAVDLCLLAHAREGPERVPVQERRGRGRVMALSRAQTFPIFIRKLTVISQRQRGQEINLNMHGM